SGCYAVVTSSLPRAAVRSAVPPWMGVRVAPRKILEDFLQAAEPLGLGHARDDRYGDSGSGRDDISFAVWRVVGRRRHARRQLGASVCQADAGQSGASRNAGGGRERV